MTLRRVWSVMLVSAALLAPSLLSAQSQDAPRVEVFGGYSWYRAGGTIPPAAANNFLGEKVEDFKKGWAGQFTYNLNHWAGIAVDVNGHYGDFGNAHSIAAGPQFKLRTDMVTPFVEAMVGLQHFGPKLYSDQNAATFFAGGGFEFRATRRLSIRPLQADYVNSYYNKLSPQGSANSFNGLRLQAGLVLNLGLPSEGGKVDLTCSAEPMAANAGTPIVIDVTPSGFMPKRTLSYAYASNGGKISGTGTTATVETAGLEPGNYMVTAKVADNGRGKHQQTASCTAAFSVNELPKHPPVLSLSVRPTSLNSGDAASITADGSSPDNRPLSYNCTSTAGRITGNGPTFTLDTAGVPESTIGVNCTVSDDRNLMASASTSVKVNANVPPPPAVKHYGAVEFMRDPKRPTRVDNQAKGELDRYADALAAAADAKGVVVGYATARENMMKKGSAPEFAELRAVNTKDYLTKEKGIDATRIEPRIGMGEAQKVELWIVPAGATFPAGGTAAVDEARVKAIPRVALKMRVHRKAHRRAAQKAAKKQ